MATGSFAEWWLECFVGASRCRPVPSLFVHWRIWTLRPLRHMTSNQKPHSVLLASFIQWSCSHLRGWPTVCTAEGGVGIFFELSQQTTRHVSSFKRESTDQKVELQGDFEYDKLAAAANAASASRLSSAPLVPNVWTLPQERLSAQNPRPTEIASTMWLIFSMTETAFSPTLSAANASSKIYSNSVKFEMNWILLN